MNTEPEVSTIEIAPGSLEKAFTQSDFWGDFQESIGKKIHRYSGKGWNALCIEHKSPIGVYWFCPYGPFAVDIGALYEAINTITIAAKEAGAIWLRIEPRINEYRPSKGVLRAPRDTEPANTTMLDLRPEQDELYRRLAKTNRQRVNKQNRDAVLTFWTSSDPEDIKKFTAMQHLVTKRTGAIFHENEYMYAQAKALMPNKQMYLEFCGLKLSEPVAGTVIHDYGDTSTYTYAASLLEARDLGAAGLLIWQSMLNAKARGMITYDFWGISPPDAKPNHPWQGFTSFKQSFGTVDVAFAGTWDIPFSPLYQVYRKRTLAMHKLHSLKHHIKNSSKKH